MVFQSIILGILFSKADALTFELPATAGEGNLFCLKQEIFAQAQIVGSLFTASAKPTSNDLDFHIFSDQNTFFKKAHCDTITKFSFTPHEDSLVHFCLTNILPSGVKPDKEAKLNITLSFQPPASSKDSSKDSNQKFKYAALLEEFDSLAELNSDVTQEMQHASYKDYRMWMQYKVIMDRVANLTTFTILLVVVSACGQVYYFYSLFKSLGML